MQFRERTAFERQKASLQASTKGNHLLLHRLSPPLSLTPAGICFRDNGLITDRQNGALSHQKRNCVIRPMWEDSACANTACPTVFLLAA